MNLGPINSQGQIAMAGITLPKASAVMLHAQCGATSRYSTFYTGRVAYAVPTGFKLRLWAYRTIHTAASAQLWHFGYGDDAVDTAAGAPTNNVLFQGNVGGNLGFDDVTTQYRVGPEYPLIGMEVPAGKYPYAFSNNAAGDIIVLAELVAV